MAIPILFEKRGPIAVLTINRPEKRNAFTLEMFRLLTEGFTQAERDEDVRCTVVCAAGGTFTSGLDLADVGPAFMQGVRPFESTAVEPWEVLGAARTKPLITAVHGHCLTLGFELALASDACIAARDSVFALREVRMGIVPAGGGIQRFILAAGWSSAMRYILTGDDLSADEAFRLHLVQEVVDTGTELERALATAENIASLPPLAVRAAIAQGRATLKEGWTAAMSGIPDTMQTLLNSEDARESVMARMEKRPSAFRGK